MLYRLSAVKVHLFHCILFFLGVYVGAEFAEGRVLGANLPRADLTMGLFVEFPVKFTDGIFPAKTIFFICPLGPLF